MTKFILIISLLLSTTLIAESIIYKHNHSDFESLIKELYSTNKNLSDEYCKKNQCDTFIYANLEYMYSNGIIIEKNKKLAYKYYKKIYNGNNKDRQLLLSMYVVADKEHRDSTKVIDLLKESCNKKDVNSCVVLGGLLYEGILIKQNKLKAKNIFENACTDGNAVACGALGYFFDYGEIVQQDKEKAKNLYEIACSGKDYNGCTSLAYLLALGDGVKKDLKMASSLWKNNCTTVNPIACYNLGILYLTGEGLKQNHQKAIALFTKACDNKSADACLVLGNAFYYGDFIKKDIKKSIESYEKACEYGNLESCGYLDTSNNEVHKDGSVMNNLYFKACNNGLSGACKKYKVSTN